MQLIASSAEHSSQEVTTLLTQLRLKQDLAIGTGLFLLALLSRLPFPGQILYHWDSINFAFALQHFDVAAGQPHTPGYILYVFLAQLVNAAVNDAQLTLVGISVISSGLAVVFLYVLGLAMFNRVTGLLAALFLASSPLFWFYGEIALPHSLDALMVIVAVWLFYRVMQGETTLVVPAAIWLGISGGLRPQTQVFLMPLALYAGWRLGWRRSLVALGVLMVVDLAWFVPLIWLTGGLFRYLEVMRQFYLAFNTTTSIVSGGGLWGITRNLRKLGMYTLYGWSLALVPAIVAGIKELRSLPTWKSTLLKDARFWLMLCWVFPGLAFYVFVHMGQQGLVFVFLPALLLLSAAGIYYLAWTRPLYRRLAITALIIGNCAIFIAAPTYPLGGDRPKLLTVDTLRQLDAYYLPRFDAVRQNFSEEHTILLSSAWRYPEYYLPSYSLVPYEIVARWELGEGLPREQHEAEINGADMGLAPDSNGFFYVILFDDDLIAFNRSSERQEWFRLPNGQQLAYMRYTPQERLYLGPQSYGIVPATAAAR
jgi:hypothetical protein